MRYLFLIFGLCFSLFTFSCAKSTQDEYAKYHIDGRAKPTVAIIPLVDKSNSELSWSLSSELTSSIRYRLLQEDNIYLLNDQKTLPLAQKVEKELFSPSFDPYLLRKVFKDVEFVVITELLEHSEVAVYSKDTVNPDDPADLKMTMRIKVYDIRKVEPTIVLQEVIHDTYRIPRQFTKTNFYQIPWGKDGFSISPIGIAHANLTKEAATRIEDYILLAKSR